MNQATQLIERLLEACSEAAVEISNLDSAENVVVKRLRREIAHAELLVGMKTEATR